MVCIAVCVLLCVYCSVCITLCVLLCVCVLFLLACFFHSRVNMQKLVSKVFWG